MEDQNQSGEPQTHSSQPARQTVPPLTDSIQGGTDVMGIISIVMVFIGFFPIGLIIGLVGASKAKKEGRSPTLSRIGWILNLIITLLIAVALIFALILAVPRLQEASRDTARRNDLARISSALETYYDVNGYYPPSLDAITDPIPAADSYGKPYNYTPEPGGCTECQSYKLETELEAGGENTIKSLRP